MKEVSYIVFETEMARLERIIKRQFVLIIIALVLLVGTNACWMWYENQFIDEVTATQEVTQSLDADDGGDAVINDGVHINGESKADSKDNDR